ncbi:MULTISPECIES: hypothetical protein [unclassified Pannonibacter]|uniref:hypothetical protein n=1 Tax=unclassified Pannonibacter TaxID=2627228 RepID=UPI001648150B|nr:MULTISPECIES: hypothetical protein [unclassified Pannonibacter]
MTAERIDKLSRLKVYGRYLDVVDAICSILKESSWSKRVLVHWRYDQLEVVVPNESIGPIYTFRWSAGEVTFTDETLLRIQDDTCSISYDLSKDTFDLDIVVSDIVYAIEWRFEDALKRARREWTVKNLEWSAIDNDLAPDVDE